MNEQLIRRISQCPNLPSLPAIAVQVLELAQRADADLTEIARIISKDPALSGKILRTVNSSFYGRSHNVSTISQALVILGLQSVKTLVLGFSLVRSLRGDKAKGFDYLTYWRRSIYAANAGRTIASRVGLVQLEEAFLAALLQDIGMLILDRVLGPEYAAIHDTVQSHAELAAAETAALGMNHAEIGGLMLGQWKLPPLLTVPIAGHHSLDRVADAALRKMAAVVNLAGTCADVYVSADPAHAIAIVRQCCKERYNMREAEADALLEEIGRSTREVASLFEINVGSELSFDEILKKANEALVEITLQSQQQANSLLEKNQKLQKEATTDALTRLANRGRFDQFLAEQLAAARSQKTPLALILLDVDKFKLINDTHGHPTGDKVLEELAKIVGSAARANDLAARYGGEEFILVLPGTTRATAASIAETIRRAIAAKPLKCGSKELAVTASFGVAACEDGSLFSEVAHLLKAADLAVYAAKHGGRNCVKVFTPKPTAPAPKAA